MRKAPSEGRSGVERCGAGGMGGRPGEGMCAVWEGRRLGALWVPRVPGPAWVDLPFLFAEVVLVVLLYSGGE